VVAQHPASRVFPLASGLHDRVGARAVPRGGAAELDRVEFTRLGVESGKGSVKVTRQSAKTACLQIGKKRYKNEEAGYAMIPALKEYSDILTNRNSFSLEFVLEIDELPTSTADYHTILSWAGAYTSQALNLELYLNKDTATDAAIMWVAWTDDGTYSGAAGTKVTKSWLIEMFPRTTYNVRIVFAQTNDATINNFDLYINNTLAGTITNQVGAFKAPFQVSESPIYIGGIGAYPNSSTGRQSGRFKIQELRLWSVALDPADATVTRFTHEALDINDHTNAGSLLGYWPLDDGHGKLIRDLSRYKNEGFFGPSVVAVCNGRTAAKGAIFLDGHTSFLQADLRYQDVYKREFRPYNQDNAGTANRYGLALRFAVLDKSFKGISHCRIAELSGGDRRDRPAAAIEVDTNGFIRVRWYDAGALRTLVALAECEAGKMYMVEFHMDGATNNQALYIDGVVQATDVRVGCDADLIKQLRIGAAVEYTTDNQTPWSRIDTVNDPVPILVEEARFWMNDLSATDVSDRWEHLLTDEQVLENPGVSTALFTYDSVTVTADGSPNTAFINSFLVPGQRISNMHDDDHVVRDEPKLHHIANIAGAAITLSTKYKGNTASRQRLALTRLGGLWEVPGRDEPIYIKDTPDAPHIDDFAPKPVTDDRGDLVETTSLSQVGTVVYLKDRSACENDLVFGLDPYENSTPPDQAVPKWRYGLLRKYDSPVRLVTRFESLNGKSDPLCIHHSNGHLIDPRWRTDSPYQDDPTPGCVAFRGGKDEVDITAVTAFNADVGGFAWWSWQGWVRIGEEQDSPAALVCLASATAQGNINHLIYLSRGTLRFRYQSAGNGRDYYATTKEFRRGWNFVEVTFDGSAAAPGNFYFFVNGKLLTLGVDTVGIGGTTLPSVGGAQILGNVATPQKHLFNGFVGEMADVRLMVGTTIPSGAHTTSYTPPVARLTTTANTVYLLPLNDGEDVKCENLVGATEYGRIESDPFVPLIEGLGECDRNLSPSAVTINSKLYMSTGSGPPKAWDGKVAKRMGIVAPQHAPTVTKQGFLKWNTDAPDYNGGNVADSDSSNMSLRFEGNNLVRVAFNAAAGFRLSGRKDSADDRDTGLWNMWIKPSRLDIPMVLFGMNFGKQSGNYAAVLIPNSTGTAMAVKFMFWDVQKGGFKYFQTLTYPITSTADWAYIWIATTFAETGGARLDAIKIRTETGTTGGLVTTFTAAAANLIDSGDLGASDQPDASSGDLLIGWSPIVISDPYYHGFYGKIAEFRMASDDDNDANHVTAYTGPTRTPEHIMKADQTDAAYEATAGCVLAGGGTAELNVASCVLNFNEGYGSTTDDAGAGNLTVTLEDYVELGVSPGTVRLRVTFYDPDSGLESNPGPEVEVLVPNPENAEPDARSWLKVSDIPISADTDRRIYRRIYRTTADGVPLLLAHTLEDNESGTVIIEVRDDLLTQAQELAYDHDAPPRYSVASSDQGRIYIGRQGSYGALYSKTFFPEYIPITNLVTLAHGLGSEVRAIGNLYGYTIFFMDEAVLVGNYISEEAGLQISIVGSDGGALSSGSLVLGANMLWRPAKNGIYAFTGTSDAYRGVPIGRPDGYWNNIDTAYRAASGCYWRERNQAIWLLKRKDSVRASVRLTLDLTEPYTKDAPPPFIFSVAEGPEFASIAVVEDLEGEQRLWAGDHAGFIWELERDETQDGWRAGFTDPVTFVGGGASTTLLPLTGSPSLDTLGEGHRNEIATVIDGVTSQRATARILINTSNSITLRDALPFTPANGSTVILGSYRRRWKSGFEDHLGEGGSQEILKAWHLVDINCEPIQGLLRVTAWIDFDEDTAYELGEFKMDAGHIKIPVRQDVPRSRFLQLQFSSVDPFLIYDYTVTARMGQEDKAQ
jgi:hypothetical protein